MAEVSQSLLVAVYMRAQDASLARSGERPAAPDVQPQHVVPGGRTLQPTTKVVESLLRHLAQKGERHVPPVLTRPAQAWPFSAQTGNGGVKFGQRRRRRRDRDKQSHGTLLPGAGQPA